MGFRFRKSKSLGPFRFTIGKKGFSSSVGGKYFRIGMSSSGKIRTTTRIPGTGLSYSSSIGGTKGRKRSKKRSSRVVAPSRVQRTSQASLSHTSIGIILIALGIILTVSLIKEGIWGVLIITIPMIYIGSTFLPFDIQSPFQKNEIPQGREAIRTENGWICPDCETENSNSSSICKGCGKYK